MLSIDPGDAEAAAMPPHQRRGRIVQAVTALLLRLSERSPLALAVEDLHWIDPQSEEVLRALVEGIAATPVLVLLTHRPGYTPPFQDQTYVSRITLRGLSAAQAVGLVGSVLRADSVPAAAVELITRRAEGNPLFVEELSRALLEDGTLQRDNGGLKLARPLSAVVIPDTVQGVIMARIDRLPEAPKAALQVASVIGREFSAQLVERVAALPQDARQALGELRAVELIYQKSAFPELAYLFKHALTHDVAYESLLKQHRRALHRRAGEVIEDLYAERLSEFYEALAGHYLQGEVWPRAVEYCLKAAGKARAHYAYRQAIRQCEDALRILETHGGPAETARAAFELLGDLESLESHIDRANEAYERARALGGAPVVFIGISRAASIGASFVAAHPELVEKLILVGPPTMPPDLREDPEFVLRRAHFTRFEELVKAGQYQDVLRDFWTQVVSEPDCRDLVQERVAMSGEYSPAVYRTFFLTQEAERLVDPNIANIRVPTLVLNGDADLVTPVAGARHLASSITGAELYVFKGRGHSLYATAPLEFAQVVRSFVRTGRPV